MKNKYFRNEFLNWYEEAAYLSALGQCLQCLSASGIYIYIYRGEVMEKYCDRLNESSAEVIHLTYLLKNFLIYVSYFTVRK